MAERCFPGISRFYKSLDDKPVTFLQLVWAFEAKRLPQPTRRKSRR
jgi:hypothetical protein